MEASCRVSIRCYGGASGKNKPVFAVVFKENDGAPPAKGIVLLDGAVA